MPEPDLLQLHGIRILSVEDSPTQALRLQHMLVGRGCHVTTARNGKEALLCLAAALPDLVITDINMPEMDGYQLCREIKEDPARNHLPVILLTSLSDPGDILRGLECGADNFIVKPCEEALLISRIQHVLANLELRRSSSSHHRQEIYFAGRKYHLDPAKVHSIELLLSTYETAVQKNLELSRAKSKLEEQTVLLRDKNAEMEADLEMARELQSSLLPRHYPVFPSHASPEQSALRFCHRYVPTSELGGDFFDIIPLSNHQAGVFICDVMGHGVRAALVTAIIRGLEEELHAAASDPGAFLTEMNRSLCSILHHTITPLFASAFYLVVDLATPSLRWSNAGHPLPQHFHRRTGTVSSFEPPHQKSPPVLGLIDTATYPTVETSLEPGDLVMLYTDGLYELEKRDGALLEPWEFNELLQKHAHLPTPELFDTLLAGLRALSRTGSFDDDICLVGVDITRRLPGSKGSTAAPA